MRMIRFKIQLPLLLSLFHLSLMGNAYSASSENITQFLTKLHFINLTEIKAGSLALMKSQTPEVRRYALTLIQHHSKAEKMVLKALSSREFPLAAIPFPQDDLEMLRRLQSQNAVNFDLAFAQEMITSHEKALSALREEMQILDESQRDIKDLIQELTPFIENHLQEARLLKEKLQ